MLQYRQENLLSRSWFQSEGTDSKMLYSLCLPANRSVWIACKQSVICLETSALQTQYSNEVFSLPSRKHSSVHRGFPCVLLQFCISPDKDPLLLLLLPDSFWQSSLHHLPDKLDDLHCTWSISQVHFLFHYEYSRIGMISWNSLLETQRSPAPPQNTLFA